MNIGGKVWQQSLMSGTFQKVWLASFLTYYLDVSVSGYLSEVCPIRVSKGKKRRYFNFSKQNDDTVHQGYLFLPGETPPVQWHHKW